MKKINFLILFLLFLFASSLSQAQEILSWKLSSEETSLLGGQLRLHLPQPLEETRQGDSFHWEKLDAQGDVLKTFKVGFSQLSSEIKEDIAKKIGSADPKAILDYYAAKNYPEHRHPRTKPWFKRGELQIYQVELDKAGDIPFGMPFGVLILNKAGEIFEAGLFLQTNCPKEFVPMQKLLIKSLRTLKAGEKVSS